MSNHRRETTFDWDPQALKAVTKFGAGIDGLVLADISEFEGHYRASLSDEEIPDRYHFKPLQKQAVHDTRGRKYELWQIYVAPGARYRAILQRSSDLLVFRWVWAFKKQKLREREEIRHAASRAAQHWSEVWSDTP